MITINNVIMMMVASAMAMMMITSAAVIMMMTTGPMIIMKTSMLMMIRRNPYREGQGRINFIDEQLVKLDIPLNDDNRCQYIAGPDGILGQSLNAIVMAMNEGYFANIHFVEYSDLVSKPQETLNAIYEFLGEEPFEHDFDDIELLMCYFK